MPRMSTQRNKEMSLFLNKQNRICYNDLCRRCTKACKQIYRDIVIQCSRYHSKRAVDMQPGIEKEDT